MTGDLLEKKKIQFEPVSNSIPFSNHYFAPHDVIAQVSKVFKVQTYYKTLINHESRCLNSRQEEVRDCAK